LVGLASVQIVLPLDELKSAGQRQLESDARSDGATGLGLLVRPLQTTAIYSASDRRYTITRTLDTR
jgi:hypothetical protein